MHYWGDGFPYFADVGEAAEYLGDFCKRWARFRGQTKEKYGTARFYATMGHLSLHGLIYPGYYYSQSPAWLWSLDIYYISPALRFLFGRLYGKWCVFIYRKAYKNAVRKWPHIRDEILHGADHLELLDDCDDIKLHWHPPCFSEKDVKRLGTRLINEMKELQENQSKLSATTALIKDLIDAGRLNAEELEYVKDICGIDYLPKSTAESGE